MFMLRLLVALFLLFAGSAHASTCRIVSDGDGTVGIPLHFWVECDDSDSAFESNGMDLTVSWDDSKWILVGHPMAPSFDVDGGFFGSGSAPVIAAPDTSISAAEASGFAAAGEYGGPNTEIPCWGYFNFPTQNFQVRTYNGWKYIYSTRIRYVRCCLPCDVTWNMPPSGAAAFYRMAEFWLTPKEGTCNSTQTVKLVQNNGYCDGQGNYTSCGGNCTGTCVPWPGTVHYDAGTEIWMDTLVNLPVYIDVCEMEQ